MNSYTFFIASIIMLPVQALTIYAMCKDIQDYIEHKRAKQKSLDNLLGRSRIDIDLTEEDMFLVENLMIHEDCTTIEQLIRKEINKIKGA